MPVYKVEFELDAIDLASARESFTIKVGVRHTFPRVEQWGYYPSLDDKTIANSEPKPYRQNANPDSPNGTPRVKRTRKPMTEEQRVAAAARLVLARAARVKNIQEAKDNANPSTGN